MKMFRAPGPRANSNSVSAPTVTDSFERHESRARGFVGLALLERGREWLAARGGRIGDGKSRTQTLAENARREGDGSGETREAELIVAIFRTVVLLAVLIGPRVLGWPVSFQLGEIWLAAVAGIYNIVTALGCWLPSRYGLRRPFIVAMDLLLITLWIQLSANWELRPFYTIVVVVAAMWFRVSGGVLTAAFCNFFFFYVWLRAASNPEIEAPMILTTPIALHAAMLFLVGCLVGYIAEAQERERERRLEDQLLIANYQREIDLSSQLQPSLNSPHLQSENTGAAPLLAGESYLEIGAAMKSARTLGGGDYFDLIALGDGRTGICIADVSGKSVRAQARLPLLKYSLRALAPLYAAPEKLVERLNETLLPDLQPELYIAFCYLVLDPKAQTLSWCNAGHIAPLLLSQNWEETGEDHIKRLKTHGPPLGMFGDIEYEAKTLPWHAKDQIVLYTDGLTDAFSYRGSEDGEAQLKKMAARLFGETHRPAREVAQELVDLATAILDDTSPLEKATTALHQTGFKYADENDDSLHRDDITVVIARFDGD